MPEEIDPKKLLRSFAQQYFPQVLPPEERSEEKKIRKVDPVAEELDVLRAKVRLLEHQIKESNAQVPSGETIAPPYVARAWPSQFIHQTTTLQPGQTDVIASYGSIRDDQVAFLRYMGVKWFPLTSIVWEIDGFEVETLTRTVGSDLTNPIAAPWIFQIPYEVLSQVRFVATNNDTTAHAFEVYMNGELVHPTQAHLVHCIRSRKHG